jgi:DNA-binding MurR/RpiR family transcriptional regulator
MEHLGTRNVPVSAVYVAPPGNHRKDRFKSVSTDVIRQTGETLDPASLAGFVNSLRQAKEAL